MTTELYSPFPERIIDLQTTAAAVSDANKGLTQRKWRVMSGWSGDPLDIPGVKTPFIRTAMNTAYQDLLNNDGSVGETIAVKLQADHLGCQERAWRLQFSTGIRCGMHAASRRKGHGMADAGSFARIVNSLTDKIIAGGV